MRGRLSLTHKHTLKTALWSPGEEGPPYPQETERKDPPPPPRKHSAGERKVDLVDNFKKSTFERPPCLSSKTFRITSFKWFLPLLLTGNAFLLWKG